MAGSVYQVEQWQNYRWESVARFYTLSITQDLFGQWVVCCSWGCLFSKRGRFTSRAVSSLDEALHLYHKTATRREKRGYCLIRQHR